MVSNYYGLIHLIVSLLALLTGTWVLFTKKGTSRHKKIGYVYVVSMVIVNATAFMIYNLWGKWGLFHWTALVSSITLLLGMLPMIIKKPADYISYHFGFMYWSVVGLYGAFVAEVMVRIPPVIFKDGIPNSTFYKMLGISIALTMGVGAYCFLRLTKKWEGIFAKVKH